MRPFFLITTICLLTAGVPSAAQVRLDPVDPYVELESRLMVGDKGELTFDVSLLSDKPQCGALWVFDHAELEILDSRFGDAQFVNLPESGCSDCSEATVRWYHEPTGYLAFEVHVYRRETHLPCTDSALQAPEVIGGADASGERQTKQQQPGAQSAQLK